MKLQEVVELDAEAYGKDLRRDYKLDKPNYTQT